MLTTFRHRRKVSQPKTDGAKDESMTTGVAKGAAAGCDAEDVAIIGIATVVAAGDCDNCASVDVVGG